MNISQKIINILRKKKKKSSKEFTHSYVFNSHIDGVLSRIGSFARKRLEQTPQENRKKIVCFIGYHHSKIVALIDAIIIMSLQMRGAEVYPVRSSYFYPKEDVIWGGVYNENRFEKLYRLSSDEGLLLSNIVQAKTIALDSFLNKEEIEFAEDFSKKVSHKDWQSIKYDDMLIGEMAYYIVANMNNQPQMNETPEQIEQFRIHIRNCVALNIASKKLLSVVKPDSIVSDIPFYYQWRIPFFNAIKLNIPIYLHTIAERRNAVFWTKNALNFFDTANCWSSFEKSDMLNRYSSIVEQGMNDRFAGNISGHKYLPNAADVSIKSIEDIKNIINGRPTILLPCNVLVDAMVLSRTKSFNSCIEMVKSVAEWFSKNPQYACILKAHPGEKIMHGLGVDVSQMGLSTALKENNIELPENVIFVDYNAGISVYSLFDMVRGVIAYSSSVCIDAGLCGKPSLSASSSHYTVADFATTPNSKQEFFDKLKDMLNNKNQVKQEEIIRLAKNYYLLYYFSGKMDYKLYQGNDIGTVPLKILFDKAEQLMPGANEALDYTCDAILNNKPIFAEDRWPPITV